MPKHFKIPNHLIIPFAVPKWEIENIQLVGVSTEATYFESETHCVHINRDAAEPLTLSKMGEAWNLDMEPFEVESGDWKETLRNMLHITREFGNLATNHEQKFAELYFQHLVDHHGSMLTFMEEEESEAGVYVLRSRLPLPQAHLYVENPLNRSQFNLRPENMFMVDFAFWTGEHLVAVEVDGGSHIGSPDHVRKDRMLQRAGVQVVHVLNEELDKHGTDVISRLLPDEIPRTGLNAKREAEEVGHVENPLDPDWLPF